MSFSVCISTLHLIHYLFIFHHVLSQQHVGGFIQLFSDDTTVIASC